MHLVRLALIALMLQAGLAQAGDSVQEALEKSQRTKMSALDLFYESHYKASLDWSQAVMVPARTLDLPWGRVELKGGWIVPVVPKALADEAKEKNVPKPEWIAAIYIGDGGFHWDAPYATEAWLLRYRYKDLTGKELGADSLDTAITGGAVLGANGSWKSLLMEGTTAGTPDSKTQKAAEKLWKDRGDMFLGSLARVATRDAFDGKDRGLLLLDMMTTGLKGAPFLTYEHDPGTFESTSLGYYKRYALNRDVIEGENMGRGPAPEVVKSKAPREIALLAEEAPYDVTHYNLDMTVQKDEETGDWGMGIVGDMDVTLTKKSRTITLGFANSAGASFQDSENTARISPASRPFQIQKFTDGDDRPVAYLHKGDEILIQLPKEMEAGESVKFKFAYQGNFIFTIKQPTPSGSLSDTSQVEAASIISWEVPVGFPWYPMADMDKYTFDWKLRLPKPMIAATSGMLLAMSDEGKFNVHTIKETVPVDLPCIVFGRFNVHENEPDYDKGEVKIRLYTHPGFDKEAQSYIDEAASVLAFYSARFGPYPYKELDMAQMAIGLGFAQAPAGIIRVTGEVYVSKTDLVNLWGVSDPQLRDYFIPHEIAHEWWGHKASWGRSDREQWVSETFAEFSAALYIEEREQQKRKDPAYLKGYTDRMSEWKTQRQGHKHTRTAPLWTGYRMGGSEWQSSVYARGPLILDMLRNELGREAIVKAMYTFAELAAKQKGLALTEDWRTVLETVRPGMSFETFLASFIKGNEPLPGDPTVKKAKDEQKN